MSRQGLVSRVRAGVVVVALALGFALSPAATANAGCGLLGLLKCPAPPPALGGSGGSAAPDPGGNENAGVTLPPPGGKLFGFNSGLYSWATTPQVEVAHERAVGANAQRIGANWKVLQPQPYLPPLPDEGGKPVGSLSYAPSELNKLDQVYLELVGKGMRPIITLGDAPRWATDYATCRLLDAACRSAANSAHIPPGAAHLSSWQLFAAAVAARYPKAAIIPWNEPNLAVFWANRPPQPARMATIQCAAYRAIKAAGPTTTVLSPALAVFAAPRSDGSPMFEDYLNRLYASGLRSCMDSLALNLYPANVLELGAGSALAQNFQIARRTRERHGDTTPIWITETGSTTFPDHGTQTWGISEAEQASLNLRLYDRLMTMGDVQAAIFHTLRNAPNPGWLGASLEAGYHYGFLRVDWSPKPVFCAFAARAGNSGYPGC